MQMSKLPFKTWKYEKQTKMKHQVFSDYFDKWIKILGKYRSLNYIDCFGGLGVYDDNGKLQPGSPILAAQIIQKNHIKLNRQTKLVIIEKETSNTNNLKKVFEYYKLDIDPIIINEDFDKAINNLLDDVPNIAPTFFLVDPFGFKIKLPTLKRIMDVDKSEIFLNFMYNGICRNLNIKDAKETLDDLFGSKDWEKLCYIKENKEKESVTLFKKQLKKFCRYVFYYRICFPNMKNRTYYYLFHLSNHEKGCSIMKSCFAKYNKGNLEYNEKYSERMKNQATLIDSQKTKVETIKKYLLSKYRGKKLDFIGIIRNLIDSTDYLESEISKALKGLELENKIEIKRFPETTLKGKKRISILNRDAVIF